MRWPLKLLIPIAATLATWMGHARFAHGDGPQARVAAANPVHPFEGNVKVTLTDDKIVVESDGLPTHPAGTFPNPTNPNRILRQNNRFTIPRHPRKAEKPTPTPFGPIGVAINGVPFYNPYNAEGRDAVLGPFAEVFDSCCGHPDPMGRYHYHKYPVCLKSPFKENGKSADSHSPLLGLMFDGYALYGPNGADGKPPADLDASNGHEDTTRGYHYHVTAKLPYLIGSYRGVVDPANIDRPRFPGRNWPFRNEMPPLPPFMTALDKNGDGALSADEIAHAADSLRTLDKNGDGTLSADELRPPRPRGGAPRGAPAEPPR